jgi:hypothetical protein
VSTSTVADPSPSDESPELPEPGQPADSSDVVVLHRRTIDSVLIGVGALMVVVLAVAGGLLAWGWNFADDYVHRELSSQNIFFPDEAALTEEGRDDLVEFAGEQVVNGDQAEAYAGYIGGHLEETADGMTYAELGTPQREARAALAAAEESGASEEEIAALQEDVATIAQQRDSLFRGETLRGLLLSTYAWSTIGRIAGIAAIVSFVAAGLMFVLVMLGVWHRQRTATALAQ